MKKSLIFWFAAITCAALFLVGCESPTNGDAGAAGSPGSVTFSGDVTDAELARAFAKSNEVILQSTVTSVYGVIPAGKTLAVFGKTAVENGESLEVAGALEIETGAELDASYVGGTAGYLKGTASGVKGAGTVKLPLVKTGVGVLPTDGIGYADGVAAVKAVGSYITGSVPGSALGNGDIVAIFTASPEITELTVSDITGLTDAAVPSGKTLTLTGTGNTVTGNLNLSTGKGTLIVDGTLEVSNDVTITGASAAANITVNGTLKLASAGTTFAIAGKVDLSGADIDATEAGVATLTLPTGATGAVGEISVGTSNALTIAGVTDTLTVESIGPQNGKGVKSDSVKTYAVKGGGSVGLATAAAAFIVKQAGIVNGTTDTEFVLDDSSGAITIASALTITNAVLKAGTTNGISVTAGAAPDTYYALSTANLAQVKGKIAYAGAVTGIAETLVIPAGVELDVSTAGTLATITGLTVNGTLTVGTPALTAIDANTDITGTGTLIAGAVADAKAVLIIESALAQATLATGTITDADLEIPATTIRTFTAAAAPSANVTVNGTAVFSGAAAPVGNVTVNGTVVVPTDGSLTIKNGKALDIAAGGVVALTGTGSLVLTSASDTSGAKITGTGKVTAGLTEISGGTSGWQAVGSHSNGVTIAALTADTASITGTSGEVFTAQGAGATITQLAGENNALTIAADTVINLKGTGSAAGGTITLTSGANPGKLAFTAATSKVLLGESQEGAGAISGVNTPTIGGRAIVIDTLVAADFKNKDSKLVQLGGTTAGNFTADVTADADVVIDSTVVAAGSAV